MKARAAYNGGSIAAKATAALKRGWYLAEETFKGRLLDMLTPNPVVRGSGRASSAVRDAGESAASRTLTEGEEMLGLPVAIEDLAGLKKSDENKVLLPTVLRTGTSVSNGWISEKLAMGHPNSISRMISNCRADPSTSRKVKSFKRC